MTCETCGEKPKKCGNCNKDFPKAVMEIDNPETLVLFRKVIIPVSMGDDTTVLPTIGKYHNVLLVYEANNHAYLYSSDGIPTKVTGSKGEQGPEGPEGRDGRDGAIQYTAGANISIDADNVISATDTTYTHFTGTDGVSAGTAGLVPGPTTSDTDKYLKSDGTWATVAGGGSNITMTDIDPGEGAPLAENNFIAVYEV